MTSEVSPAYLLETASGRLVPAQLRDAIGEQQLIDWEDDWVPALQAEVQRLKDAGVERALLPQSRHWNWRRKHAERDQILAAPTFCVTCAGKTQGLMTVSTLATARLPEHRGKDLVYVEYLESAPWNQKSLLGGEPRYRGVGSLLLRVAVELSRSEGFKGRIGLHSLPQSNDWYGNRCGMTDLGVDISYQKLRYFEMTTRQAEAFIAMGGQL